MNGGNRAHVGPQDAAPASEPLLMRLGGVFATLYCFLASVPLLGGLAGALPYVVDAREVTREQWLVAAAPLYVVTMVLMAVIAYGLLRHRVWSRHVVMAHWVVVFAWALLLLIRNTVPSALALRVLAQSVVLGSFAAWYFYRKRNVVAYFHALSQRQATGSAP